MPVKRTGVLGGCFNPVHNGHLRLALEVFYALKLDSVELLPTARPPHKAHSGILPFDLRKKMCAKAIAHTPQLILNTMEAKRPGLSYTFDTLTELTKNRLTQQFVFILGAADLLTLPDWGRGLEILTIADLAIVERADRQWKKTKTFIKKYFPQATETSPQKYTLPQAHTIQLIPCPRLDISASMIRNIWCENKSLLGLVPPCVENTLYTHKDKVNAAWCKKQS